jgi:hypothetical protein
LPALARLLRLPGFTGHHVTTFAALGATQTPDRDENGTRNLCLRELFLAVALYRCGDLEGLGESILRDYAEDLRGHYRRHARGILAEGPR